MQGHEIGWQSMAIRFTKDGCNGTLPPVGERGECETLP